MATAEQLTLMFRAGAALGTVIDDLAQMLDRFQRQSGVVPGQDPAVDAVTGPLRDTLAIWRISLQACASEVATLDPAFLPEEIDDAGREAMVMDVVRGGIDRALAAWEELRVVRRDYYSHPLCAALDALDVPEAAKYEVLDYYRATDRDRRLGTAFTALERASASLEATPSLGL